MKNLRIGARVYHFLQMGRVGCVVNVETVPMTVMSTEGSLSGLTVITVRFDDGTEEKYRPDDLMNED